MYFALGWPKVLACRPSDIVYLHLDAEHLVVVATDSVQLWTGGQHRVKLAAWCATRSRSRQRASTAGPAGWAPSACWPSW